MGIFSFIPDITETLIVKEENQVIFDVVIPIKSPIISILWNFLVDESGCLESSRAIRKDPKCLWPGGIVPYQFYNGPDQNFVYSLNEKKIVNKVNVLLYIILEYQLMSLITFILQNTCVC
jgi:hypothetical protein